ncbi:MAG: NADH-quinone oxidoreductase subunit NuoG [Pseudomonadota bacterium]
MPLVTINGTKHEVEAGMSVLQACELAGIEIPRFCYHDRLSVAGNCRMCLVEIKPGPPKPAASCAMPIADGMEIFTDSEMVRKGRQGVMEFLLINHPLDCPICDQGGECDLQDQAMGYGYGISRYQEKKRAVTNKHMGPLISTIMTRCIHCTRCVRFASEIAGVDAIGLLGRGEGAEISALEQTVRSELSGNVIDLCPVGALTSKPYAFVARPWELEKTPSIDVFDAVGSNIRIDSRGGRVLRILPRLHENINEEWISDKVRFSFDALALQRLDQPWLRGGDGRLHPVSWAEAFDALVNRWNGLKGEQIGAIIGDQLDCETMFAAKQLLEHLGCPNLDCRQDGSLLDNKFSAGYLFNTGIAGLEKADAVLMVGTNPRFEAPLIHARLRKAWLHGQMQAALIGEEADFTFPCKHLGTNADALLQLEKGEGVFASTLEKAQNPAILLGAGVLARPDGQAILAQIHAICQRYHIVRDGWNGFNLLHHAASRVGGMMLDILPGPDGLSTNAMIAAARQGRLKSLWLLGTDQHVIEDADDCFVVYQGHHGDESASQADLILPGAAFCEKPGSWVNLEGRVQLGEQAIFPPHEARADWKIIRALAGHLEVDLGFDALTTLRKQMREACPHLSQLDTPLQGESGPLGDADGAIDYGASFKNPIDNFYMSDPISRHSPTMAKCTRAMRDETHHHA